MCDTTPGSSNIRIDCGSFLTQSILIYWVAPTRNAHIRFLMNIILSRNQKIKTRIRAALQALPLGLGASVAIPLISWLLRVFVYQTAIISFRHKQYVKCEARSIDNAIRAGRQQATLVYDNSVSPPTYGDYLYVVLLARYFIAHGININFLIVDSEYRHDWINLTEIEKKNFVNEQITLAKMLLDSTLAKIERASWDSVQQRFVGKSSGYFPFVKCINKREAIYNKSFNLLNQLLHNKESALVERVLFSYEEFSRKIELTTINMPYITWGCRYSEKWGLDRNISDKEFINIYLQLQKRFPHHLVMIVSDTIGCKHFSQLANKHGYSCIVSKEYSQTFLGDGALILNSDLFLQLRGGGVSTFAMFSKIPYECTQPIVNECMWSKSKLTSFQTTSQLFINGTDWNGGVRKHDDK
jgi:hypothetical protein